MTFDNVFALLARLLVWGGVLAALALSAALSALVVWAVAGPWWPTTLVQYSYRRKRSGWALSQALVVATLPVLISVNVGTAVGILTFFLFAPRYVNWRVRKGAWWDDVPAIREGARTIRNRLRDRQELPLFMAGEGPWQEYVNDVVRWTRDRDYTPPEAGPPSKPPPPA